MADGIVDVWINCPDRETARTIAEALVAERLAACANILAPIESVYVWRGAVEREPEVPLVVKTRSGLFDRLSARVEELHPYDVPGVMGLPVGQVNAAYRDWLHAETGERGSDG